MLEIKKLKNWLIIFLLALLILPAVWSLLKPGFFSSHDGEWMVIRFSAFHQAFRDGQFPVRWAGRLNHNYGYPIFNFLYPFAFYLAEIFHLVGFSFVDSIKAVFILSFFLSGFLMYWWISLKWGKAAGLVSAVFYVWTPYRFLDVYVRGSLGEAAAFIFPPLIFLSFEKLKKNKSSFWLSIGAFSYAGLITAHNTMAMLFTGVLAFYLLIFLFINKPKLYTLYFILYTFLLGLALSAFFWLPALHDKQYTIFSKTLISNFFFHFPTLKQLLFPSWGFSPSLPLTDKETISFQIGIWNLLAVLLGIIYFLSHFFQKRRINLQKDWESVCFLVVFLIAFFLMTPSSWLVWRLLLVYNFIQFPWRLLSITTFTSSFLAGFIIQKFQGKKQVIFSLIFIFGIIITSFSYARPQTFINRPESFYSTNEDSTTVAAEYTPIWVKNLPSRRPVKKVEILKGKGEVKNLKTKSNKISFNVIAQEPLVFRVNLHWFPGWQLTVDGEKKEIDFEKDGLINFSLTKGTHEVVLEFQETPFRLLADFISLFSLMTIVGLWFRKKLGFEF